MFRTVDMFNVFQRYRGDAIVVPGRGGRFWLPMSKQPRLDVPLGDPAMGGHASFAAGLAMAQPNKKVILFDSDGDIVMNMGILATIAEQAPENFYHFVLDNECYATTGGQPIPNAKNIAYDVIAKGAGYPRTYSIETLEDFEVNIEGILSQPGPVFITMKVVPEIENEPINRRAKWQTRSRADMLRDLQVELGCYEGQ